MRRLMTILATLGCALTLSACWGGNDQKAEQPAATAEEQAASAPLRTATPRQQPAPVAVATATCMTNGLAADKRTLAQARTLQVGAEVTINGVKKLLAAGQSYWSLCAGPTTEERLALVTKERDEARAALVIATEELNAAKTELRDSRSIATKAEPAKKENGISWRQWPYLLCGIVIGIAIGWFFTSRRRRGPHQIGASGPREPRQPGIQPDDAGSPAFDH